jgi:hypothetical protein
MLKAVGIDNLTVFHIHADGQMPSIRAAGDAGNPVTAESVEVKGRNR